MAQHVEEMKDINSRHNTAYQYSDFSIEPREKGRRKHETNSLKAFRILLHNFKHI